MLRNNDRLAARHVVLSCANLLLLQAEAARKAGAANSTGGGDEEPEIYGT